MDTPMPFDPQSAIDKMPPPPNDPVNRKTFSKVPEENRYTYSEPYNDRHTPTPNPVATTNYPLKSKSPGSA